MPVGTTRSSSYSPRLPGRTVGNPRTTSYAVVANMLRFRWRETPCSKYMMPQFISRRPHPPLSCFGEGGCVQPQKKSITDPKTQDPQLRSNVSHSGNRSTGSPCIATVFPRQMALTCSAPPQARAVSREAAPSGRALGGGRIRRTYATSLVHVHQHQLALAVHSYTQRVQCPFLPCVVVVYMFNQAERPERTLRIPNVTKFLNILASQFTKQPKAKPTSF